MTLLEKTQEFIRFVEENHYGRVVEIRLDEAAYMTLERSCRFLTGNSTWTTGIVVNTPEGETRIYKVDT